MSQWGAIHGSGLWVGARAMLEGSESVQADGGAGPAHMGLPVVPPPQAPEGAGDATFPTWCTGPVGKEGRWLGD